MGKHYCSEINEILPLSSIERFANRYYWHSGRQRTFHRVILAATIQMFLQMTGVNAITSYASTIYEAST
jgi:hypothetical protein